LELFVAIKKVIWIAGLFASFLWAGAANAAFATGGHCSLGTQTGGISVGDVKFEGNSADDCFGLVRIGGNVEDELSNINGLGWGTYDDIKFLKDDSGGTDSGSFLGLNWTLAAQNGNGSGSWVLTVTDPSPGTAPDLPIVVDIIAFMKAGQPGAFFFFEDVLIDTSNDGTFSIAWKVGNGPNGGNTPGLSGFSLFFGEATSRVPEPGSVALLGLALAGLGLVTRRRR
jgi:hypothetical protein